MKRALFLDRDGVINHMVLYPYGWDSPQKLEDVKLIAEISKIISWANKNKIKVIEVSNQPGVAKGKMSQEASDAIEAKVHILLKERGAVINKVYICPHHPKAVIPKFKKDCDCRKPKPGLILKAASQIRIDLTQSLMLGDKASDAAAGEATGLKTILFLHKDDEMSKNLEAEKVSAFYKTKSIEKAFQKIRGYFKLK